MGVTVQMSIIDGLVLTKNGTLTDVVSCTHRQYKSQCYERKGSCVLGVDEGKYLKVIDAQISSTSCSMFHFHMCEVVQAGNKIE